MFDSEKAIKKFKILTEFENEIKNVTDAKT
jgi:hypothetical protein